MTGALVTDVEVFDARSLRRHDAGADAFAQAMRGRTILSAVRRGKFLWFPLAPGGPADAPEALTAHLGMSGQLLLREPGTVDRLTRVRLGLQHPVHGELQVNFVDQRIFGHLAVDVLVPTADALPGGFGGATDAQPAVPSRVAHIARDPLDAAFDERAFVERLRRRATGVKRAILDQTLVSGIGNIYADEALWAARLHFEQRADSLSVKKARQLLGEVKTVLTKALAEGGTSFDAQYVNVNGASGYFAHSLNAYGRQGEPCARCGRLIERRSFMNRSSHFCPRCQRLRAPVTPS